MKKNYVTEYKNVLVDILNKIDSTQQENIDKVAQMMADTIIEGGDLYAFGPSHAGMIVEEMVYRAGGLALMNPIHLANLLPNCRPMNLTTNLERLPGYASAYFEKLGLKKGDFLLIHSVSARIPVVIEMAMRAKEAGLKLAGIVNLDFASKVTSLDPSGKMMQEICDVVIDDCGEVGDASILIDACRCKSSSNLYCIWLLHRKLSCHPDCRKIAGSRCRTACNPQRKYRWLQRKKCRTV